MNTRMTRRELALRYGPAALLLWPILRARKSTAAPADDAYYVQVFTPNGVDPGAFWPSGEGPTPSFDGKCTAAMAPFIDEALFLRGVNLRDGGHHAVPRVFTNSAAISGFSDGPSLDWFLADRFSESDLATPVHSLQIGVDCTQPSASNCSPTYNASGLRQPVENDPQVIFDRLFGDVDACTNVGVDPAVGQRLSVLDRVSEDLSWAQVDLGLGAEERMAIERHQEAIASVQQELEDLDSANDELCEGDALENLLQRIQTSDMPDRLAVHAEVLALAFALDLTRVANLSLFFEGGNEGAPVTDLQWFRYGEGGYDPAGDPVGSFHHRLSHRGNSEVSGATEKLFAVDSWVWQGIAHLLQTFADTPSSSGNSLLDQTLLLHASTMGDGRQHSGGNIPIVIAGGHRGTIPTGLVNAGGVRHGRVLTSVLHALGLDDVDSFGSDGNAEALY